ncbi:MAG: HPr family phosphocarrier protein [Oligosphaeraceae bacterium]|nr:HPr family phosphocarrier protein [Oligosphaeraceae bacterium]
MASSKVRVRNPKGIHVRPAGLIVSSIKDYEGKVEVVGREGKRASLQSVLSLLSLGLAEGDEVTVEVDGPDAEKVCEELSELFARHFDFPQQ